MASVFVAYIHQRGFNVSVAGEPSPRRRAGDF
jgi:hypothetical protein